MPGMTLIYRKTPAREAIIDFFSISKSPADAADILKFLRSKNLNTNKVTVYRNLENLYKNGTLERLEFGEGKFRYEIIKNHHHHLICQNCGRVEDVEGEFVKDMETQIQDKSGFLVKSHSLEFFGLCKDCQK